MFVNKLQLFNKRARYLAESRFIKWLETHGNKQPDMARLVLGDWLVFEGLHREDLDSFFLNFRLLIQDRDGFSIESLANIYEKFPADYDEAKMVFNDLREKINDYLTQESILKFHEKHLTNNDVLEIILYGGIAHNNPKHYPKFIKMTEAGLYSLFTMITLWNIVKVLNRRIQQIALLNNEIISWEMDSQQRL